MKHIDAFALPPGLVAVTGDEGTGKSHLLRRIGEQASAWGVPAGDTVSWLDLSLPGMDAQGPADVWDGMRAGQPRWNAGLHGALVGALDLEDHLGKQLFMLSTGTRRKVALAALLASGARITCLDQPFAALDAPSARVVREYLADAADQPVRTWVVADHVADPRLAWKLRIALD